MHSYLLCGLRKTRASTMLKFFVLSLLAVACSGSPMNQVDSSDLSDYLRQYKEVALKYFGHYPEQADPDNFDAKYVKFYLYTREAPSKVELVPYNLETLRNSSYNVKKETKILIHSWLSTEKNANELVSAYLRDHDRELNVITVDFDAYTGGEYKDFLKVYGRIGEAVGHLMKMLYEYGSHADHMHLIGFGFGAHIAAAASKYVYPMRPGRITGLDPIGTEFDSNSALVQLNYKDADVVDTITTNMNGIGSSKPRGTIRFFPNGGATQPTTRVIPIGSSGSIVDSEMFYSHIKAYFYFVESVYRECPFKAVRSSERNPSSNGIYSKDQQTKSLYSNGQYLKGQNSEMDACMGEYVSKRSLGNYFVDTNPLPPYGKNSEGDEPTTVSNSFSTESFNSQSAESSESEQLQKKVFRKDIDRDNSRRSRMSAGDPIWQIVV